MNELKIFENKEFGQVRTVEIDNTPYFVGKDVCEAFGDTNYRRSLAALDEGDKGVSQIDTPGGKQNMVIVNESGLYSLLFQMQPQKAKGVSQNDLAIEERIQKLKRFKHWVTSEVLPSIRKHGAYMTPEKIEEVLLNPDTIIRLATDLKAEREQRIALEAKVEQDKPLVLFANSVAVAQTSILVGELAKLLKQNGINIGQNRLFESLRNKGFLIKRKGSDWNMPTQRSMEMGLFEIKETIISHSDGHTSISKTVKVTGKGQIYFVDLFLKKKIS